MNWTFFVWKPCCQTYRECAKQKQNNGCIMSNHGQLICEKGRGIACLSPNATFSMIMFENTSVCVCHSANLINQKFHLNPANVLYSNCQMYVPDWRLPCSVIMNVRVLCIFKRVAKLILWTLPMLSTRTNIGKWVIRNLKDYCDKLKYNMLKTKAMWLSYGTCFILVWFQRRRNLHIQF